MNKNFIKHFRILLSLIGMTTLFGGCGQRSTGTEGLLKEQTTVATYVCPMRCERSESHKPGVCPVCNMMLVKSIELDTIPEIHSHANQSVYNMEHVWTDQNNEVFDLHQGEGKYQLVSMIFTSCEYACPNLIGDMLNIDENVNDDNKNLLNFILISIDPERDTPERLGTYADDMELNLDRWVLLNGDINAVNAFSTALGVSYKKFENGAFGHSNMISLLNTKGEIIYQLEGIHSNRKELVNLINQL